MIKINQWLKIIFSMMIVGFMSGCSNQVEYLQVKGKLYKKTLDIKPILDLSWDTRDKYNQFEIETQKSLFSGYLVEFIRIKPYLEISSNYKYKLIALRTIYPWSRSQGLMDRKKYTDPYTFMMFTLNQEPFDKKLLLYFNRINEIYETKLNSKDINKFVKYDCDKNIVFSKYERDENYQPLVATCYVKRLDEDVFLITRFAHPNTDKDKKVFSKMIIPEMLKSIKLTPTKLSPWKSN